MRFPSSWFIIVKRNGSSIVRKVKIKSMDGLEVDLTARLFVERLSEIEELAEEIITDKEQIKELDHKRNTNREALTAIKKCNDTDSKKSWICLGGMFIKYPTCNISEMIKKDQEELECEMDKIRNELKEKVSKLHQLEGKKPTKGFNLNALRKEELSASTVQNY